MFGRRRDAEHWLERGRALLLQGKGRSAENSFGRVLREKPGSLVGLKGLMEAWLLQGKSHVVIEHFDSLARVQQERWHELLLIALAMQVGHLKAEGYLSWLRLPAQVPERLVEIREVAEKYPKCGALAIQWVESALLAFEIEEANHGLRQLRDAEPRVSPKLVAHLYAQRDALLLRERVDVAEVLQRAASLKPAERLKLLLPYAREMMSFAPLQKDVGTAYFEMGEPEVAMRYLNRAANANPYWLTAWVELGLASMAAMRLTRARESFLRAMSLNDSNWIGDLLDEIDIKLIESPELSRMEPALDRLAARDPSGAIEPLQRAIDINNKRVETQWLMGQALSEMGELGRSTAILRDAWKSLDAEDNSLRQRIREQLEKDLYSRYLTFLSEGWADEAVDLLKEVLDLGAGTLLLEDAHRLAKRVVNGSLSADALLAFEEGRPHDDELIFDCIGLLRNALAIEPDFPEAQMTLALLLVEAGDLEVAWDEVLALRDKVEPREMILFHIAGVAFRRQDLETAEFYWQLCVESKKSPWAEIAAQNILSIHTGKEAMIAVAKAPTFTKSIAFSRSQDIGLSVGMPASNDYLFEITPSVEIRAAAYPLQEASEEAEFVVPKLSDLAPTASVMGLPSAPSIEEKTSAEEVLEETEHLSEVALFDSNKAPKPGEESEFPFSLHDSESIMDLPAAPSDPDKPLFEISPSAEIQIDLPMEQIKDRPEMAIPRLSDLAPDGETKAPDWVDYAELPPPQPLDDSAAAVLEDGPTQRDTLPLGSNTSALASVQEEEPSSASDFKSVDDLFENHDDLDSLLDDVFVNLEDKD